MSKTSAQRLLHYICLSGFLVACLASCANRPQPTAASTLAIVGGTVVHPQRDAARAVAPNSVIVVTDGRISAVGPADSLPIPAGAAVVDARGKWIVPGLIDAHVHFFQSGNLYTRPDAADLRKAVPYAREVARNQARLAATFKVYLASGVTSVVDIGGPFWNFDVRDAAQRSPAAPRVSVAGPLISTVDDPPLDLGDPPIIKITTADEARALVRRELARQPDYIKVWFIYRSDADLPAQEIIVKAAADEAHAAGTPLAVHATQLVVAKAALRAGADYLVHSVDDASVDDEFLRLAIARRIVYCPTLFVVSGYRLALSNTWKPTPAELRLGDPEILAAMDDLKRIPREIIPDRVLKSMANPPSAEPSEFAMKNLRKVWDAGIPVAMGTDAGNIGTLHGPSVFREMSLMQQAGLTPLEVLRSATVYGAKAARHEKDVGIIDAGRFADMVLLDADPLIDVMNLSRVYRVIKGGSVFDPDELIRSIR
jgi:imidazolonepropionase-like amidohydrolase